MGVSFTGALSSYFFYLFFATPTLLYLPGGLCGAESPEHVYRPLYRGSKKHALRLTRQDVLSSVTHTHSSLSTPHTATHTHTHRHQFQLSTEKKSQPTGSARQQIGAKDYGNSHVLCILGRLSLCLNFTLASCLCNHMKNTA